MDFLAGQQGQQHLGSPYFTGRDVEQITVEHNQILIFADTEATGAGFAPDSRRRLQKPSTTLKRNWVSSFWCAAPTIQP